MKKIHVIMLSLVAVFAFSAFASSAFAADEWLANGAAISTALTANTEGELLLEDTSLGLDVNCSGKFEGTVGPGAADEITKVVDLEGKNPLHCSAASCEGGLATVTPVHLPWKTKVVLSGEKFLDELGPGTGGEPGYKVSGCKILGIETTDECTGKTDSELTNGTGDVNGTFSENEAITPRGNCTFGGEKKGLVVGTGLTSVSGVTLSVS
jgi:hypothetical protein